MNNTFKIHIILRMVFLGALFLAYSTDPLAAQGNLVTGTITSPNGEPIPGASVLVKGSAIGVAADIDGKFSISAPANSTLVFSFIGMVKKEILVGNQTIINVVLEQDIPTLSEYVVVGYAPIERRDLTSSVSSVGAKQLADIPLNSAGEALAGRLAGAQVTGTEGSPNAEVLIRVRSGGI